MSAISLPTDGQHRTLWWKEGLKFGSIMFMLKKCFPVLLSWRKFISLWIFFLAWRLYHWTHITWLQCFNTSWLYSMRQMLVEWFQKEPWSLLLEILHIARLSEHADQRPMSQFILELRQIFQLHRTCHRTNEKRVSKPLLVSTWIQTMDLQCKPSRYQLSYDDFTISLWILQSLCSVLTKACSIWLSLFSTARPDKINQIWTSFSCLFEL